MRTYLYTISKTKPRPHGGYNQEVKVYRILRNTPVFKGLFLGILPVIKAMRQP